MDIPSGPRSANNGCPSGKRIIPGADQISSIGTEKDLATGGCNGTVGKCIQNIQQQPQHDGRDVTDRLDHTDSPDAAMVPAARVENVSAQLQQALPVEPEQRPSAAQPRSPVRWALVL